MIWAILGLTFLATVLFVYGIYIVLFGKKIVTLKRLEQNTLDPDTYNAAVSEPKLTVREKMDKSIQYLARPVPKWKYLKKKKKKLVQADIKMKPEEFFIISMLAGIAAAAIFYVVTASILVIPVGIILGFIIPDIILGAAKNKRGRMLNSQIPGALTIISNGLRAGYSFSQAMGVAVKEMEDPVSNEFSKVLRDNSMGKPIEEALTDMSQRTEDDDVDMFVTALIIQRQVGGNLAEILDTIADTIRERVKLRGDIKTLTAEGKFSALVITLLPIAIAAVIFFLNPSYISTLFTTVIGVVMVAAAVIMEIVGVILLKKIVNIEI